MKHNLLKSVILSVILLLGANSVWGASPIYSIGDVYITGSMNGWSTNSANWKLGSGNHCEKTFYVKEDDNNNYTFKLYLKQNYYTNDGYWFTKTNAGPAYSLSTSGNNMEIQTKDINAASGYVKLVFDFWGEYGGDSKLSVTQSAVSNLSPSLSATLTSLVASEKSTITASCSGGSGSYSYTYKVTCGGQDVTSSTLSTTSGGSVTFTAPEQDTEKTYTITVTAKDAHVLLDDLATKTATQTITVAAHIPTTIFLAPNSNWKQANARFAIYYWRGSKEQWIEMTEVGCNGDFYTATIPAGYLDFKFVRLNPSNFKLDWSNRWTDTENLSIQANKNLLSIISIFSVFSKKMFI